MAIAKGLVSYKKMNPSEIYLSRKKSELLAGEKKEGYVISDNPTLVAECDFIFLAVLPGQDRPKR